MVAATQTEDDSHGPRITLASATTKLYGGALTVNLAGTWIDGSGLRPVPDTQELFLSPSGDESLIVDILEPVEPGDDAKAVRYVAQTRAT
jgi:hypothetical protein